MMSAECRKSRPLSSRYIKYWKCWSERDYFDMIRRFKSASIRSVTMNTSE